MDNSEREHLINRIKQLEEKVEQLRVSRRILIQLVEKIEREKHSLLENMEKECKYLRKQNAKFARIIMEKNKKLLDVLNK